MIINLNIPIAQNFFLKVTTVFSIVILLAIFLLPAPANAGVKSDCNSRADPDKCKAEVDDKCGGKSGDERSTCIDGVLRNYVLTGLGGQRVRNCTADVDAANCLTNLPRVKDTPTQVENILRLVFGVAAGVALISLMIAAFNYATAETDAEKVVRSKKAIITSLMGLVVVLGAQALVLTILERL
ncbi:MAG TPA: hypothetical protein VD947_00820 [Patescibacteria group bacterium]|nr:hypothetical protein [Patescibacteria group bacterium]